jgi:H+/Cl- antiporter ClcA
MAWASVVGIVGGLLASAYYFVLEGAIFLVWEVLEEGLYGILSEPMASWTPVWLVTGLGGLLVGITLKKMGVPGEISAVVDNIHLRRGRIDIRQTPSMVVSSLVSISFGGSAGPEAPLVQIIGSLGSWFGDRLRLHGHLIRTLTFCGMAAALGAFFGAPLGGALFALEIPHRRGLEYYEALVPSIVAALLSFLVFRSIIGYEGPLYHFSALPGASLFTILQGVGLGLLGALVAALFVLIFKGVAALAEPLEKHTILLATLGGVAIGLVAEVLPEDFPVPVLFWGEFQIRDIIASSDEMMVAYGVPLMIGLLLLLAVLKMLAIGFTLHSGFRGGFIFPLFFIGAAVGLALSVATGGWVTPAVSMLCLMAAVNVAVTKTPISTSVILTTLSGTSMLPVIVASSFTSFLFTTRIALIGTQRARRHFQPEPEN